MAWTHMQFTDRCTTQSRGCSSQGEVNTAKSEKLADRAEVQTWSKQTVYLRQAVRFVPEKKESRTMKRLLGSGQSVNQWQASRPKKQQCQWGVGSRWICDRQMSHDKKAGRWSNNADGEWSDGTSVTGRWVNNKEAFQWQRWGWKHGWGRKAGKLTRKQTRNAGRRQAESVLGDQAEEHWTVLHGR